jgi:hypothetical protein
VDGFYPVDGQRGDPFVLYHNGRITFQEFGKNLSLKLIYHIGGIALFDIER